MTVAEGLRSATRWWWLLLAMALCGAAAALALSLLVPPRYEATTTLLVTQRPGATAIELSDLQATEHLAATFSRLMLLDPVLTRAAESLRDGTTPARLERHVAVRNPRGTQLLEIEAWAPTPEGAAASANALATAFVTGDELRQVGPAPSVGIVDAARAPTDPVWPRLPLNVALGAIGGLLAAGGLIALRESMDETIRTPAEAARVRVPVLAQLPRVRGQKQPADALQVALAPSSEVAETYRALRTALLYALGPSELGKVVLACAPRPGAGASTVTANLAVALGLAGRRVVIVDADLREGAQEAIFGVQSTYGLSTWLRAREDLELARVVQPTSQPNVALLTAGPVAPNPSELLGSARVPRLLGRLRETFDVILIDAHAVLAATDAAVLADLADASVIVTQSGKTTITDLRAAVEVLGRSGRPVAGAVLNRARSRDIVAAYSTSRPARDVETARETASRGE